MASKSHIEWPVGLAGHAGNSTWTEGTHAQKQLNAAGEKFASLVWFDGSELDSIAWACGAGTACTTHTLTIQAPNYTHDTVDATGYPDGTAIANSTVGVGTVGGSAGWITHTFGATGPSPVGPHWIVHAPVGGAFNVNLRYVSEWAAQSYFERMWDGTDWGQAVTLGPTPYRIKRKDGTYLESGLLQYPPFSSVVETVNSRATVVTGNAVHGVKFVAPFDMVVTGIRGCVTVGVYADHEIVLINSSNTVLARGTGPVYYWNQTIDSFIGLPEEVQLTGGEAYRLYFKNPATDANSLGLSQTVTTASGGYAWINLASGDWQYTTATSPVSEGGAGAWTDTATELPIVTLVGWQDIDALAGETDVNKVLDNSSIISGAVNVANVLNTETHGTYVPAATGDVQNGVTFGAASALTGTFISPATTDVRTGITYGNAAEYTGTCAVPTAAQVLIGVSVDATTGTVTQAGVGDVRNGTTFGPSLTLTGTAHIPVAANVLSGVSVDATTGTYVVVATGNVRSGTTYGAASALTGTLAVPAASNVLNGVSVDAGTGTYVTVATGDVQSGVTYGAASALTGTFAPPAVGDVQSGVTYGNAGEYSGVFAVPAVGDVEAGVTYGNAGEFTGTFAVPAEADVADGVFYGAASEFEGTLVVGGGSGEIVNAY